MIKEKSHGADHTDVMRDKDLLAIAYFNQEKYDEMLPLKQQLLGFYCGQ